jgi:hypothetical protein
MYKEKYLVQVVTMWMRSLCGDCKIEGSGFTINPSVDYNRYYGLVLFGDYTITADNIKFFIIRNPKVLQ